jgi:predicted porin
MKKKLLAMAAAAAVLPMTHAADFKAGNWDMSVGGNINAFYTGVNCSGGTVEGGLANKAKACGEGKSNATTIGNGLLPSMLNVGAKTNQDGYDIAAVIGMGVSTATNSSIGVNNGVDVRNAYVTFGNKDMGTFKMGRDYGLFGLTPVLSDMTLLGVGAAYRATQNGRVSLGHLGAGYTYAGTYGQMAYTSPTFGNGMTVDFGLMNPVDNGTTSLAGSGPATQARLTYANQGFKAWVAQKNQSYDTFKMNATEVGASLGSGPFGLVANYQSGTGLGILADADQGNIKGQNTFLQATYKASPKVKVGLGTGKSENKSGTGTAFRSNQSTTAGVYFNLTPSLTLVGEVGDTTSKDYSNTQAKQKSYSFGGIFFF